MTIEHQTKKFTLTQAPASDEGAQRLADAHTHTHTRVNIHMHTHTRTHAQMHTHLPAAHMHAGAGSSAGGNQQRQVTKFSKSQLVQVRWQKQAMADEWWDAEILIFHKKKNASTCTVLCGLTHENKRKGGVSSGESYQGSATQLAIARSTRISDSAESYILRSNPKCAFEAHDVESPLCSTERRRK